MQTLTSALETGPDNILIKYSPTIRAWDYPTFSAPPMCDNQICWTRTQAWAMGNTTMPDDSKLLVSVECLVRTFSDPPVNNNLYPLNSLLTYM